MLNFHFNAHVILLQVHRHAASTQEAEAKVIFVKYFSMLIKSTFYGNWNHLRLNSSNSSEIREIFSYILI